MGSLVVSLAWLVGSCSFVVSLVASLASLVGLLASSPAASRARCVGAFFGRRLPAVVYLGHDPHHGSRLSCSPLCTWGMTRTTVPVLYLGHTAKILLTNNADDDGGSYAMVTAMTMS